jgi:hypothetical protein
MALLVFFNACTHRLLIRASAKFSDPFEHQDGIETAVAVRRQIFT